MAVVVAGLFDDQTQATEAMDVILRSNYKDLDTHVIEPGQGNATGSGPVIPVVPNTGGGGMGQPGIPGAGDAFGVGIGAGIVSGGWFDTMNDVERAFYHEGLREGATLALVKVDDDHADEVREVFRRSGARTYVED